MKSIKEELAYKADYASELNPLLFEGNTLKPEIKEKIVQIVSAFLEYAEVNINIADIRLVGSNASYNYNDYSDLDVHIVTDLSKVSDPETIARLYFDSVKRNFRDSYDIKIKGINVEIYVEDINATAVSNGIYSLSQDKWIKEPQVVESPSESDVKEAERIEKDVVMKLKAATTADQLETVINNLYLLRKDSLASQGESSPGNIAFKSLRNRGVLDQVKDVIRDAESMKLSLESKKMQV